MPGGNGTGTGSGNGPLQLNKTGSAGSGIDTSPAPQPAQMSRTASPAPVPSPEMETQSRSASVSAMQQTPMIQITSAQREDYMMRTQSEFQVTTTETIQMLGRQLKERSYDQAKTFFHWKRKPSTQMQGLIKAIEAFNTMLDQPIIAERFDKDMKKLQSNYLTITQACNTYFEKHPNPGTDEGKFRLSHVRRIFDIASRELSLLEHNAEYYKKTNKAGSWKDVVASERTMSYTNHSMGVSITQEGGGTSYLAVIDDGQKTQYYKKKAEVTTPRIQSCAEMTKASYRDDPGVDQATKAKKDEILQAFIDVADYYETHTRDGYRMLLDTIKDNLKQKGFVRGFFRDGDGMEIKALTSLYDRYYGTAEWALYEETVIEFAKQVNFNYVGSTLAKIPEGGEAAARNALTSRMAELLGVGNLIVKSSMCKMQIDGESSEGVVMEQAQGANLEKIFNDPQCKGKKLITSPDVLKELTTLQVFDALCGQVDRNAGNVIYQYRVIEDAVYLEHITGIDNDMSFGNLSYKEITGEVGDGAHELIPFYQYTRDNPKVLRLLALDSEFAHTLLDLTPAQLDLITSDVLSIEERQNLADRLAGLQEDVRLLMQQDETSKEKHILSSEGWADLRDVLDESLETKKTNVGYVRRDLMERITIPN